MKIANNSLDIVIIGGGTVGLAAACLLANANLSVMVIESGQAPATLTLNDYDLRVSAITKASQNLLQNLNVWPEICKLRATPFQGITATDTRSGNSIHFDCAEIAEPALGFIIENCVLRSVLWQKLSSYPSVKIITEKKLAAIHPHEKCVEIILDDHATIEAKLVIGADGAHSRVRQLADISITEKSYQQQALVATIKTSLPHQEIARQRFLETGPLAFLPLNEPHLCSIVWSTTPEHADQLKNQSPEEFNQTLAKAFNYDLGRTTLQSERASFPLIMRHAHQYVKPRIALIGDAAHTIHPLAGQGLNLGLQDAAALAEIIVTSQKKNRDIGNVLNLRQYERWQKSHNANMISLMGGFHWAFSQPSHWIQKFLPWGIDFFERTAPLKQWTMHQAMGFRYNMPKIMESPSKSPT